MTRAIIVGSEGQDGRILFDMLAAEGSAVLGIGRDAVRSTDDERCSLVDVGFRDQVVDLLRSWKPDEIYYIAAEHQASQEMPVGDDADLLQRSLRVHVTGLTHFLQTLAEDHSPASFFYAASSLVFGDVKTTPQDESTPFRPRCIYGITKAAGVHICRFYRERHHVNASAGILYNHESPLRKRTFVSQKIVRAATAIASGSEEKLELGDLSARVDWGYAPDFVDAMTRIVRVAEPDDYVIATGESHSVQDFVEVAFGRFGLDWRRHVVERPSLLVRAPVERVGNPARLRERTGWAPQVSFAQMVEILVDAAQRHNAA